MKQIDERIALATFYGESDPFGDIEDVLGGLSAARRS